MREVDVETRSGKFQQTIRVAAHEIIGDEPKELGGEDAGAAPHELLLAALGECTSMTVKMYADRKGWKVDRVRVHLVMEKTAGETTILRRTVSILGDVTDEQRGRLLEIAAKCPVHKTLSGKLELPIVAGPT